VTIDDYKLTGERPPTQPPTAEEYSAAGLPWFEYYGADHGAIAGSKILAGVSPVGKLCHSAEGVLLPDSGDVAIGPPVKLV
jgi:hypothetical protein